MWYNIFFFTNSIPNLIHIGGSFLDLDRAFQKFEGNMSIRIENVSKYPGLLFQLLQHCPTTHRLLQLVVKESDTKNRYEHLGLVVVLRVVSRDGSTVTGDMTLCHHHSTVCYSGDMTLITIVHTVSH